MKIFSFYAGLFAFALTLKALAAPMPLNMSAVETYRNWAQWRGPLATGAAPEADPPLEWSETKNVKWKVAIPGNGSSSPVIWNDRVFVLTAIPAAKPAGAKSDEEKTSEAKSADSRPPGAPPRDGGQA